MVRVRWWLGPLIWVAACGGGGDKPSTGDTAGDVAGEVAVMDADTATETDADARIDASQDTEADADAATETDADVAETLDADAGPDADADADASPDADADAATDADTMPETQPEIPPVCGNGEVEGTEACDEGTANSDTAPDACRTDCSDPRCGDGVTDTGEECDDGNDDALDACTPGCVAGPGLPAPGPGGVVITELMINPTAAQDPLGEWIELWNIGPNEVSLSSCVVFDGGTDAFPLSGLVVPGGGRVVLGFSGDTAINGGVEVDLAYGTMLLDNLSDEVVLQCGKTEVDRVDYSNAFFPVEAGKAMSLDPAYSTAKKNDGSIGWCVAATPYGKGDLGTPGLANPVCIAAAPQVDSCRLAPPASHDIVLTQSVTHAIEIFEPGLTTKSPAVDGSPGLRVQLGFGDAGTLPSDGGFTWTAAGPVLDWSDPTGLDGYQGTVKPSAVGSYDVAGRVSLDLGQTWVYCDLGPMGSEDGYALEDAVRLEVAENPCNGFACDAPPASVCDAEGVRVIGYTEVGATCGVVDGVPQCTYPSSVTDCGLLGSICEAATATCGGEVSAPSVAGQIIFTEFLVDALAVSDSAGFWIELHNPGDTALDLEGCSFSLGGTKAHTIGSPLVIGPDGYRVLAPVVNPLLNGGVAVDYALSTAVDTPSSGGGVPQLHCGGVAIDQVVCAPGSWPVSAGKATSLSPFARDATANDDPDNWCAASTPFGAGDLGTPGSANPPCPGDVETVDSCHIATPSPATLPAGTSTTVRLRLTEAPLTLSTPGTDTSAALAVEVGYGPFGSAPDADWTWLPAVPNGAWSANAGGAPAGTDEWLGELTVPPAGEWGVVFRVTVDAGHSASLCDRTGLADGFAPTQALSLISEASACDPDPCVAPPGLQCDADTVVDLQLPATCGLAADDTAACEWTSSSLDDCAALGGLCADGACEELPVAPAATQVIFTELAIAPGTDEQGEWLELTNVSKDTFISLATCELVSGSGVTWSFASAPFEASLLLPGASKAFTRSADPKVNGGVAPAAVYTSAFAMPNKSGSVQLVCESGMIDRVIWDDSKGWIIPVGLPLSLAGNRLNAAQNDLAGAWCPGAAAATGKPAGTPGAANPLCPPPDAVVDSCRFEGPASLEVTLGDSFTVSGLISDFGNTNLSPGVDAAPGTRAQVGIGAPGADAQSGADFVWFEGAPDPDWNDVGATGADRWLGEATASSAGLAALAVRFSLDNGASWLACDLDGSDNGYSPAQAGVLNVLPTPCAPNPCTAPPAASCDGDVVSMGLAPGVCSVDEAGAPVCEYETRSVDCAPYGGCAAGDCVTAPPGPKVAGDLVITEVMRRSGLGTPDLGEWLEILNTTDTTLAVDGCRLSDATGQLATVVPAIPLLVAPGERLVFGASADPAANGGLVVDFAWGSKFSLDNVFDEVTLRCGGVIMDRVAWISGWPGGLGVAMQTTSASVGAADNDLVSAWCAATTMYGPHGLLGTPGSAGPECK
ncbi:MAG: lamin tail domain-containing protein [Myxococcota bacterium]